MRKYIVGILMLIVLLFAYGCSPSENTSATTPYIGGTKGIVAHFEPLGIWNDATSTEEIFEDETFPIEITLQNKGEEDVLAGKAKAKLLGIALNDFSGIVAQGTLSNAAVIEKVSEVNTDGGEITLDFTPGSTKAKYLIPLAGASYDVQLFAEAIYDYKTHAEVPQVCFKEDFSNPDICTIDETKTVFASGAPIQVTGVEEKRAGTGKIALEFKVENVGGGQVAMPGAEFNSRYDQFAFKPSEALWECKSKGVNEGRFDSAGAAKIICLLKTPMAKGTLYTKSLELTLEYQYKFLIQSSVRIRQQ